MKLATIRHNGTTFAVRVDNDQLVEIPGFADVGALLADPDWRDLASAADGPARSRDTVADEDWAPVVSSPRKIVCVGLNYRNHILEMGRELPEHPTLFAKYPDALIGAFDPIELPPGAGDAVDWEGELAVVVGKRVRRVSAEEASDAIAGYAVLNDVTMRDFQYRTPEWFQGKTFEATTPFGPYLVTADEFAGDRELRTEVDGEVVQRTNTDDLVFSPAELIAYVSQIFTLDPGDVIATGTPGGVGHARKPPRYLTAGSELVTSIESLGAQRNRIVAGA